MKAIERIKLLMCNLPDQKDIKLGLKFLELRNFESLQSLVNSSIYKTKKKFKNKEEFDREEYHNIIDPMEYLKLEIDNYVLQLDLTVDDYDVHFADLTDVYYD